MEQRLHLVAPFVEVVVLGSLLRCGSHGNLANLESVEFLEPRTPTKQGPQVDDAEAEPVEPPVIHPAALVGAAVLRVALSLGQLHGDLGEVLHDEDETKAGENY